MSIKSRMMLRLFQTNTARENRTACSPTAAMCFSRVSRKVSVILCCSYAVIAAS